MSCFIGHKAFRSFKDRLKELELEMESIDQDSLEGRAEYRSLDKEHACIA